MTEGWSQGKWDEQDQTFLCLIKHPTDADDTTEIYIPERDQLLF